MQRRGVYFNAADNNRIHGKMQMHYRLRMQDDGRPLLQVFKNCTQFIRTIPMLVYSLTKVEEWTQIAKIILTIRRGIF